MTQIEEMWNDLAAQQSEAGVEVTADKNWVVVTAEEIK